MSNVDISNYRSIFYPKSLAIIGATANPMKFGNQFLQANITHGFKGKIYPVNPKGGTIQGLKAYPSVNHIPGKVDLAVITVPISLVPEAIKSCAMKGVKGVEILTSGFRESGSHGEKLENDVLKIARDGGMRIIGPNCFGIYSPKAGLTLLPGGDFSKTPGKTGLFSQSGGGACEVMYSARGRNVNFSVAVSYGNGCDIDATEMLRYFEADPDTLVVGAYIEGVKDGRSFFQALKSCAAKKPVVIFKGGTGEHGNRGTLGHTGSMAGSGQVWEAVIKSAGAVAAHNMRDLVECLMAFNCITDFSGKNAGILAGGGQLAVNALDEAFESGFKIPETDIVTTSRIQSHLPPTGAKGGNPVDLSSPVMPSNVINSILEILSEKNNIDFLVVLQVLFYLFRRDRKIASLSGKKASGIDYHKEITSKIQEIRSKFNKPVSMVLLDVASDPENCEIELEKARVRDYYTAHKIPCFDTAAQAFSVLKRVFDYYNRQENDQNNKG
jgi:acyl-CoA synthetase (NDP forming)